MFEAGGPLPDHVARGNHVHFRLPDIDDGVNEYDTSLSANSHNNQEVFASVCDTGSSGQDAERFATLAKIFRISNLAVVLPKPKLRLLFATAGADDFPFPVAPLSLKVTMIFRLFHSSG